MIRTFHRWLIFVLLAMPQFFALAQEFNYDEDKVPEFTLPDPLVFQDGRPVVNASDWTDARRGEVLQLFESHVYGQVPSSTSEVSFSKPTVNRSVLGGAAIQKQVKLTFSGGGNELTADLLLYLPKTSSGPCPVFLGLNFNGNHTMTDEPDIWLPTSWIRTGRDDSVVDNRATDKGRGNSSSRWPVKEIVARGYGVATMYCGDIDPDFDDGFKNGVHALFESSGSEQRSGDAWGTISAWAWGLSRALDYLETDNDVDAAKVAVLGHSRLGKTAMWAGASDERFALVISNNSGCGGAALSRRRFGETVQRINTAFPHWFCKNFHTYSDNENALPVDQHMLAALVAPRPLYVASAEEDQWADPRGEFLTLKYASPVFELLGRKGCSDAEMPGLNQPIMRDVAYHIRPGRHDVTLYDWQRYMDFADQQFRK